MWHDASELPPCLYATHLVRTPDTGIGYALAYRDEEVWRVASNEAIEDLYVRDPISEITVTEWMDAASFRMMVKETQ